MQQNIVYLERGPFMDKKNNSSYNQLSRYRKRMQELREKEEAYWASMNGPVIVTKRADK